MENKISNKSYEKIFESFQFVYPELKKSIEEWHKDEFTKETRTIGITLKNGIRIIFGSMRDENNEWDWFAVMNPSKKNEESMISNGDVEED